MPFRWAARGRIGLNLMQYRRSAPGRRSQKILRPGPSECAGSETKFFGHASLKEMDCIDSGVRRIESEHTQARTVIDGGVLKAAPLRSCPGETSPQRCELAKLLREPHRVFAERIGGL